MEDKTVLIKVIYRTIFIGRHTSSYSYLRDMTGKRFSAVVRKGKIIGLIPFGDRYFFEV